MIPDLLPGDLILTRSNGWVSKSIRFFQKLGSGSARVSHAAMSLGGRMIVESLMEVTINRLEKYEGKQIIVYRLTGKTDNQRKQVSEETALRAGQNYPWWRIPLNAMDNVASFVRRKPTFWFTKPAGIPKYHECAQLWAHMWQVHGGFDMSLDWRHVTPDNLDDWLKENPTFCEVIYLNL